MSVRLVLTHVSDLALVGVRRAYGDRVLYVEPMPGSEEWLVVVLKAQAIPTQRAET